MAGPISEKSSSSIVISDGSVSSENGYESSSSNGLAASTDGEYQLTKEEAQKRRKLRTKFLNSTREYRSLWKSLEHLEAEDLAKTLYNLHSIKRLCSTDDTANSSRRHSRRRQSSDSAGEKRALEDDWKDWRINKRQVTAWPAESYRVPRLGERHANKKSEADVLDSNHLDPGLVPPQKLLRESGKWLKEELCSYAIANIREKLRGEHSSHFESQPSIEKSTITHTSSGPQSESNFKSTNNHDSGDASSEASSERFSMELDEEESCHKLAMATERIMAKSDQLLLELRELRVQQFGKLNTTYYVVAAGNNKDSAAAQDEALKRARSSDSTELRGRSLRRKSTEDSQSRASSSMSHVDQDLIEDFRRRLFRSGLPGTATYSTYKRSIRITSKLDNSFIDQEYREIKVDLAKIAYRDHKVAAKLGSMDWRHVLGMAASLGWDTGIISKAKQRCEALFGKKILMNTLPPADNKAAVKAADQDQETASINSDSEADLFQDWKSSTRAGGLFASVEPEPRPQLPTIDLDPNARACPWNDCPRHDEPYDTLWRLREHMKRAHGVLGIESDVEPEILEGLHRDSFLQPVSLWRQSDFNA